ncbi:MAG: peptidyl-prolyl cis-trans isomerase [Maricaulaceae bacterium]|jgi:peptidyl-prolyl cis-trans isomerase D
MLNQLRNAARSWIGAIFVAVLVASFSVWGVSDVLRGRVGDAVVLAGDAQIGSAQFRAAFDAQLSQLTSQTGQRMTRDQALDMGIDQAVAQRLGMQAGLEQKAESLGVVASNRAVARELAQYDAFVDPITEGFSRELYLRALANAQISPIQFEREIRLEVLNRQLFSPLVTGLHPSDAMVEARLRFENERRDLAIVEIPAAAADDIEEPTEEELEAFYQQRIDTYRTPARRALSVVTLRLDDFVNDAPVDEELLRAQYEIEAARLGTPETRDVVEIVAPDEAAAANAAERLRAGEDAEAVAEALGLAAPRTYDDAVPADLLSGAAGEAAFALETGAVSDPIDGGIAWFVVRVDEITPADTPSFEEARAEIELELARDTAMTLQFDAIDALQIALDSGGSLERGAVAARTPAFSFWPVDARGLDAAGSAPLVFLQAPEILAAGFSLPAEGVTSELLELGDDGYYAVRVDRIIPAETLPFAEVRDRVHAELTGLRRSERLNELAEQVQAELETGASPSAAAGVVESARGERSELSRMETTPTIAPGLLGQVFAADLGGVVIGSTSSGGRAVVRVDGVDPGTEAPEGQLELMRAQLGFEMQNDVEQLFDTHLRRRYQIRVDQRLLRQALGLDPDQ